MMVMTAKVDMKKVIAILAAVAALIIGLIALLGEDAGSAATSASTAVSTNDDRVKFLTDLGWEVTTSPAETSQVRIPQEQSEVFDRYNALQKSQGYDLSAYAGKNVMRYVYKIENYPGATEPVYATLLIWKNQIIGGDITDTAANGMIQPLKKLQPQRPKLLPQPLSIADGPASTAGTAVPDRDQFINSVNHRFIPAEHTTVGVIWLHHPDTVAGINQTFPAKPVDIPPAVCLPRTGQPGFQAKIGPLLPQGQHRFGKVQITAPGHTAAKQSRAVIRRLLHFPCQKNFQCFAPGILFMIAPG